MSKPVTYNATLLHRTDLTDKLSIFRVQPDTPAEAEAAPIPEFFGGQYTVLGLNNESDPAHGSVQRPYSIASPPEEKGYLEFYIRYVDHPTSPNPLTHLLWRLKPGDRLHLGKKFTGHFTIESTIGHDDHRLKVMVGAGTGLAPFMSILLSYLRRGYPPQEFAVLHGARHPHDLGYRDDLLKVFESIPERYLPTVSRAHEQHPWEGVVGRVETFFDDEKLGDLERKLGLPHGGLTPEHAVVYICGFQGTIHSTLVRLLKRGFVPSDRTIRKALGLDHIPASLFFEQYDDLSILDVKNHEEMARLLQSTPFKK